MLNLAVHAIMKHLGGEAMEVDEEDNLGLLRLARVGPKFAIVERFGDRAKNRPPGFALYRIAEEAAGLSRSIRSTCFSCCKGNTFDGPFHLQLIEHPGGWWDEVMGAIHEALEPIAPRPN